MKKIKLTMQLLTKAILSVMLFSTFYVTAQETSDFRVKNPPIFLEAFGGNRALSYQMIVNKKFQSIPKLGFFGVTNLQPEWGEPQMKDYMLQGNLTYSIIKGIDLETGFIWNPIDGVRPSTGILFSYGNPNLLMVINPRIDLSKDPNFDVLGLIEYKPKLNDKLNFYSRFQGLYTRTLGIDLHSRSYIMLRAGITIKDITFGMANNFDWYGPIKFRENNFGAFVAFNLF